MRAKYLLIGVTVLAIGAGLWWVVGAWTYDDLEQDHAVGVLGPQIPLRSPIEIVNEDACEKA